MGRVVKGFIIGACVCIALGIVIFVGAAMSGGIKGAKAMLENDGFIGISINGGTVGISSDDFKKWNAASEHVIPLDGNEIPSLKMQLGAGDFQIMESDSADIVVKSNKNIKVAKSGNNITIKADDNGFLGIIGNNTCNIAIEVPKGTTFHDIDMEIGAGVLDCPNLKAESISLEIGAGTIHMDGYTCKKANISVGAGEIIVDGGQVNDMDIDVGMGNFFFQGIVDGNLDVDCGMGNAELELEGLEENYNYQIDCGMGNVTVGRTSYAGVGAGHEIDNDAEFDFDLDCGMGNLEIRFEE